jgi:hypothetical protein
MFRQKVERGISPTVREGPAFCFKAKGALPNGRASAPIIISANRISPQATSSHLYPFPRAPLK